MKTRLCTLSLGLLFATSTAWAGDIASSVHDKQAKDSDDYSTIELGLALAYVDNPHVSTQRVMDGWQLEINGAGEWRKNRFFIELSQGTQDGANIGLNLWQNKRWSVDFLAASMQGWIRDLSDDDDTEVPVDPDTLSEEELQGIEANLNRRLEKRQTFYSGTGLRVTHYRNNYVIQYRLISDTFEGNGVISTLRVGRGWQFRNWNLSAIGSAQYTSEGTNNYLFGVSNREATTRYPEFNANSSLSYSLVLNATKPLSEHWVMRSFLGYQYLGNNISDSPLLNNANVSVAAISLNYVFF